MQTVDRILNFSKPPILLVGSGLTQRYAPNAPNWKELLRRISDRAHIDEGEFVRLNEYAEHENAEYSLPLLANKINDRINQKLDHGDYKIQDILEKSEYDQYLKMEANAVKIMAASEFMDLELTDDPDKVKEITYLRKLPDVVPCVITTNYDTLLEKSLFENKFKTYSNVSDYYLSGSQGIGEVYKIHGTCEDPKTMVLDDTDYTKFDKNSKIVSAKILSILCDYPLLIIGYSMSDHDIRSILSDLVSSLSEEKMLEIEKNIIYVSYKPGCSGLTCKTNVFDLGGGRYLPLQSIETDNFESIFKEIADMEASVSPNTIRKVRQIIKKVTIVEGSRAEHFKIIGVDDIDNDADKLVVVLTNEVHANVMMKTVVFNVDDMIKSIIENDDKIDPNVLVEFFNNNGQKVFSR